MYRTYAYIKFKLKSPLSIGSGTALESDRDILRNSRGKPYIPGTALAGIYSRFFTEGDRKLYFGFVEKATRDHPVSEAAESKVITYDAVLAEDGHCFTNIRNCVRLDRFRTAETGAKYDFEIIEPGAEFWTAVEYISNDPDTFPIDIILNAWKNDDIIIGAKSTRGMGRLSPCELAIKRFDLSKKEDAAAWLTFDIYSYEYQEEDKWTAESIQNAGDSIRIRLTLKMEGPLSVRVYTTEVAEAGESVPDQKQLVQRRLSGEKVVEDAVIPGTSWAGAFRHSMIQHIGGVWKNTEKRIEELFGSVVISDKRKTNDEGSSGSDEKSKRSKIRFSETVFNNGKFKNITRNAIDRFSGGAADTALFTEKMYYGGHGGKLEITAPYSALCSDPDFMRALAASVADLHEGFLTVGGESSIGHGLFSVESIDIQTPHGKNKKEFKKEDSGENIYNYIMNQVRKGAVNE